MQEPLCLWTQRAHLAIDLCPNSQVTIMFMLPGQQPFGSSLLLGELPPLLLFLEPSELI